MELIEITSEADVRRLARRGETDSEDPVVFERARAILARVRASGDVALRELTKEFDQVELTSIQVPGSELEAAFERTPAKVQKALKLAASRIRAFARRQRRSLRHFQTTQGGITLGQRIVPIERAGVYVPGGRYPLPSTALMGVVPALAAGVKEVAVVTPPSRETGRPSDVVLAACKIAGATEVHAVGGAQAIAALALGTETIRAVDKIVGPGNVYVQAAKTLVAGRVGVDLPAGPSEALVVAEPGSDPELAAWDLVAQCEHDPRARAWLVSWSADQIKAVERACLDALEQIETREIAKLSFERARAILVRDAREAARVSDAIGPEHLAVHADDPGRLARAFRNYGALFLGSLTAIPLGDFILGPNHTLPTGGASRFAGGLSALHFLNVRTFASVEPSGLARIEGAARAIARAEGLVGHERAIEARRSRSKKR